METIQENINLNTSLNVMYAPKSISKIGMLSLLFLLISFSSFAKTTHLEKEKETSEIRKQLFSQITFPDFMIEKESGEENVSVLFKIEKGGKIKVIRTDSKNETLNKFILTEMEQAKLEAINSTEETIYKINIRFKLL